MRKNVKRTIAVLSAVCMLPCPQVANVAVMAQNVSVGSSIGAKTLKQSLQTSTNFETASGINIPYVIKPRRAGDIATCYADPSKAKLELGWEAKRDLATMCVDAWRWQKGNPDGYAK